LKHVHRAVGAFASVALAASFSLTAQTKGAQTTVAQTTIDNAPLRGRYALPEKAASAATPGETPVTFYIEGEAARAMYRSMKTKGVPEECLGGLTKRTRLMWCNESADKKSYACTFSIDAGTPKMVPPPGEDC
jgi:hypothetical protein